MNNNENAIKGKWFEIRDSIKEAWGKLNDSELDETQGGMDAVSSLIKKRYGELDEHDSQKLSDIYSRGADAQSEQSGRSGQARQPGQSVQPGRSGQAGQSGQSGQPEQVGRSGQTGQPKDQPFKQKPDHKNSSTHQKI